MKKENFDSKDHPNYKGARPGMTPCAAVTGWPVCGGVCSNNRHCMPWGQPPRPHGCDCV